MDKKYRYGELKNCIICGMEFRPRDKGTKQNFPRKTWALTILGIDGGYLHTPTSTIENTTCYHFWRRAMSNFSTRARPLDGGYTGITIRSGVDTSVFSLDKEALRELARVVNDAVRADAEREIARNQCRSTNHAETSLRYLADRTRKTSNI